MIGTITLNPCIDRTVVINAFVYGGMNRIQQNRRDMSGKGINVSLALMQNGCPVRTGGFIYQENRDRFLKALADQGIDFQGIGVPGELRENVKVLDASKSITTELNQSGYPIGKENVDKFLVFAKEFVKGLSCVTLSGSVPKGVPADIYRQLIAICHEAHVSCILDAEGVLLMEGLKAHPFLIKPNLFEFETTFSVKCPQREDIRRESLKIIREGLVDVICVTLGKDGAMITDKDQSYFSPALPVEVKSTQGAGDSVVAGICMAMERKLPLSDMLRYGTAMSHGSITREGTLMCRKEDFQYYLEKVKVESV